MESNHRNQYSKSLFHPGPLWVGLVLYVLSFLVYYPPLSGIEDEQGFINQAIFWAHGGISAEGAGLPITLGDLMEVHGRHLPMRHPGRSLVALPFYLVGGYDSLFLSGILLHVALVLVAAGVLRRLGLSTVWALLVLFHPTLLIYSRTIMADAPAGLGLLICVYALAGESRPTRRDLILAGLGLGFAATMRHHAVAALPVVVWAAYKRTRSIQDVMVLLASSALSATPLMLFNLVAYGSLMDPFSANRGAFGLQYLAEQVPFYSMAMSFFWPLMFFAPFWLSGYLRPVICGVCAVFFLLFSTYYFHDKTASPIQTAIVGLRLMQVALPAWIISYAIVLSQLTHNFSIQKHFAKVSQITLVRSQSLLALIPWLFVAFGTSMTLAIFHTHQNRLLDMAARRQAVINAIPSGGFLLNEGILPKLLGVYRTDQPQYEIYGVTFLGQRSYNDEDIRPKIASGIPVHLVYSAKFTGEKPTPTFTELLERLGAEPVPSQHPQVLIWRPSRNLPESMK